MLDSRVAAANNKRPASCWTCGPSGALFGIDQEVVTLRGLLRQLRVLLWKPRRDL